MPPSSGANLARWLCPFRLGRWYDANLLAEAEHVHHVPVFGDLAMADPVHVDAAEREGLAGGWDAQELSDVGTGVTPAQDDDVAFGDDVVDRPGGVEGPEQVRGSLFEACQAGGLPGKRGVVAVVARRYLVERADVAAVDDVPACTGAAAPCWRGLSSCPPVCRAGCWSGGGLAGCGDDPELLKQPVQVHDVPVLGHLPAAERMDVDTRESELSSGGRDAHEAAGVGAGLAPADSNPVALGDQVLHAELEWVERVQDRLNPGLEVSAPVALPGERVVLGPSIRHSVTATSQPAPSSSWDTPP